MRTKHILTALAIPALFAACVADDFNEAVTGSDMAQRALLSEDFKLNFGGPDTRFSAGEGSGLSFSYEVGDTIGGAIIDQYDPSKPEGQQFPVVPYVSTNHPFVLNAQGEWAINHTMVEGNYLFYFPYNENNHARTAPMYSIPVMQDLSGKDGKFDPKASVEKYNMGVGAQFLNKEDLNASLQLVNIFGYAKIKVVIDNHYAGGYVDKIVLQANGSNEFALNGQISNKTVSELFAKLETSTKDYQDALKQMTETSDFALDENDTDEKLYIDDELNKTSKVMVAKVPEGTELKADGQNNKTFETYLVVPAQDFASVPNDSEVTLYIYTTEGNVYAGGIQNWNVTRNGIMSVTVSVNTPDEIPYVVTSEEDWNNYVSLLGKNQNSDKDGAAKFIIAGEDFAITNNTKYPTNGAEITVEGTLKVAGDNVTMKNVSADEVVIEEGAKLTTDGTFAAKSIENNGTLEFAVVYDEEKEDKIVNYEGVESVVNEANATLNILKDAIVTFALDNKIDKDDADIHGEMTINAGAKVTLTTGSTNSGLITNNGTLNGSFTNNAEVIIRDPAIMDDEEQTNRYTPTIVNNGNITIENGTLTNNGNIENNEGAVISCVNNSNIAQINNSGSIDVAVGSRMLITSNTNGEVVLHALNQTNWTIQTKGGVVAYETTAADNTATGIDFTTTGKNITKLYVTGSLNIAKMGTSLTEIEMTEDATAATLTLPNKATWAGALAVREGANVVITEAGTTPAGMTLGNLFVEEDATLTVNEGDALTVTTVENNGTVYVGGKFTASETSKDNAGEGEFLSTSEETGNIIFGTEPLEDVELANALKSLYEGWFSNTTMIGKTYKSWADVTAANIAEKTSWIAPWAAPLQKAVIEAAGEAYDKEEGFVAFMSRPEIAKVINDLAAAAKVEADKKLAEEIKKLDNTTWLGEDAYLEQTAGSIIKVGTEEEETPTTLAVGFVAYIKDATNGFLNGKTDKGVILSAGSYTYNAADVPAYSYAPAYAGTSTYEVLEGLNTLANSTVVDDWFGESSRKWVAEQFNTLEGVKEAVIAVSDKMDATGNDALTGAEKIIVEGCGITDAYVQEVILDWKYTDETIEALNALFSK